MGEIWAYFKASGRTWFGTRKMGWYVEWGFWEEMDFKHRVGIIYRLRKKKKKTCEKMERTRTYTFEYMYLIVSAGMHIVVPTCRYVSCVYTQVYVFLSTRICLTVSTCSYEWATLELGFFTYSIVVISPVHFSSSSSFLQYPNACQ